MITVLGRLLKSCWYWSTSNFNELNCSWKSKYQISLFNLNYASTKKTAEKPNKSLRPTNENNKPVIVIVLNPKHRTSSGIALYVLESYVQVRHLHVILPQDQEYLLLKKTYKSILSVLILNFRFEKNRSNAPEICVKSS